MLNAVTYLPLRDAIIKAALDEPRAVIIDVTALAVPAPSAWAVFTSARWHVAQWPDVPIVLVCGDSDGRDDMRRNGITRYLPVHPSIEAAIDGLPSTGEQYRRRARAELPPLPASVRRARELTTQWLTVWDKARFIPVASVVVTEFVENAITHAEGDVWLRLESDETTVTVAVEDTSPVEAARREPSAPGVRVGGLEIIAATCRAWGNAPTPFGKAVWAAIGPENLID